MENLFALLLLLSIISFFFGLIKPSLVKMRSRKRASLTFAGTTILFFILFGIAYKTKDAQDEVPVVASTAQAVSPAKPQPPVPLTDDQKIHNIVQSVIGDHSQEAVYQGTDIQNDESPAPQGSKYLVITLDTGTFLDSESIINRTGTFASQIFQNVFAQFKDAYDISVLYDGKIIDQYGNTKDSLLVSYTMDRPLYSKVNWSGFSQTGNDIHLCAFLREEFSRMSQSDKNGSVVGCVVNTSDLRQVENKIEMSSPAYRDIPQYN